MQYISKKQLWILVSMVLLVGCLLLLGQKSAQESVLKNPKTIVPPSQTITGEQSFVYDGGTAEQRQLNIRQVAIKSSSSNLSYTEALELYKNEILQFNDNCQLSSKGTSFHLGNEVMIDNRSSKSRTITIGTASLVVGPYDYGFIILEEKGTSVSVSCSEQSNVAELMIQ